ncbi:hypothetical protein RRG08_027668 [Elysia crispata]|uniref:Uncharacterized protein n=1 Tax=Elysia crispata TaxID=231223 RepID=A0AAE1CIP4_9GAST|nr:hypothetical protein RRG08_027668 [Elysia crispata]
MFREKWRPSSRAALEVMTGISWRNVMIILEKSNENINKQQPRPYEINMSRMKDGKGYRNKPSEDGIQQNGLLLHSHNAESRENLRVPC